MGWPKYWSFSFNSSPSNEYSGLISFRMDWLDLLAVQGTLKSLLQHHSSKASILRELFGKFQNTCGVCRDGLKGGRRVGSRWTAVAAAAAVQQGRGLQRPGVQRCQAQREGAELTTVLALGPMATTPWDLSCWASVLPGTRLEAVAWGLLRREASWGWARADLGRGRGVENIF